jgi:GGDEF domain-containing protein/HAMP domain-containing protein
MKIKTTLVLAGLWFSISAIIAFMITSTVMLTARTEQNYGELINSAAVSSAVNAELYITSLEGSFAALSELAAQFDNNSERRNFLTSYAQNRADIEFIGVNRLFSTVGEGDHADLSARITEYAAFDSGNIFLFPYRDAPTREFGLAISGNVGEGDSVLIVVYSADAINNLAESAALPAEGRHVLFDSAGNSIDRGRFTQGFSPQRNETHSISTIGETGWTIMALGNIKMIRESAGDALDGLLIMVVTLCITGIVITVIITKKFGSPLTEMSKATSQFRRGDHTVRIKVAKGNARNEYGETAARFNDFADSISGKDESSPNGQKDGAAAGKPAQLRISGIKLDSLTGVYSKESIEDYITALIAGENKTSFTPFAVICISLRDLADINDEHGHASGDLMLEFAARELEEILCEFGAESAKDLTKEFPEKLPEKLPEESEQERGKIGRYSGNVFIVAVKETSESTVNTLAAQIKKRLRVGYTEDTGKQVQVRTDIGITVVTDTPAQTAGIISAAINNMRFRK